MDKTHKYNIGETVSILRDKKLGIIERILITEETQIDREGTNHSRNVRYGVRSNWLSVFDYDESTLKPSKKQLHNDAFRVQNGQVILRENREYVVEDARAEEYSGPGARMGDSDVWKKWHVKARELSGGKYNPKGKMIEFNQEDEKPIDIVRKMDVKTTYK